MTVLDPIPGDADAVIALAASLEGSAEDLRSILRSARAMSAGSVWDGPAGQAFGERLGELGPVLQRVVDRYLAAAAALRAYAPDLEAAQQRAQAAIEEGDDATAQVQAIEERLSSLAASGQPWEFAEIQAEVGRQRLQVGRQLAAEAAHAQAWDDVQAADDVCAEALDRAAEDGIADPGLYRLLVSVADWGSQAGQVGPIGLAMPEFAPILTTLATAGTIAEAGLLLFYDEGSWSQLGVDAALTGVGFAGKSLKLGATAGAVKGVNGRYAVERALSTRERLGLGLRAQTTRAVAGLHGAGKVPDLAATPVSIAGFAAPRAFREKVTSAITAQANARLLDDLRMVRVNGTSTMYVSGVTLQTGAAASRATHKPPS